MPMYNLIEYSDNYAKASGNLWQYYRDEPNDNLEDSESFKYKIKITGKTPTVGNEKDVEIMVRSKYLSNFWRTLEMPLINCEVNLILTCSSTCVFTDSAGAGTFEITDTKLNDLVELSFQGVNRIFVLAFENGTQRTSHSGYYLRNVEIKNYNIMINGENVFDQPMKNNKVTYENIRKIASCQ